MQLHGRGLSSSSSCPNPRVVPGFFFFFFVVFSTQIFLSPLPPHVSPASKRRGSYSPFLRIWVPTCTDGGPPSDGVFELSKESLVRPLDPPLLQAWRPSAPYWSFWQRRPDSSGPTIFGIFFFPTIVMPLPAFGPFSDGRDLIRVSLLFIFPPGPHASPYREAPLIAA